MKITMEIKNARLKMKQKKSQGMPINVIIIAALALIVLVVLILIFTGYIGTANKNINGCTSRGGQCAKDYKAGCPSDHPIPLIVGGDECTTVNNLCCLKIK